MAIGNVSDFVIRYKGHTRYNSSKIVEDDAIEVILQKLEMLLFTNKGEILGDSGNKFGGDIEYMLWSTALPNNIMKMRIIDQINNYIPELPIMGYTFDLKLYEGQYDDIMKLEFVINGYNINFVLEK